MPIKFYIPNWNNELTEGQRPKRASRRFRALIPLKGMRPEDGIIGEVSQARPGDIVVLAKKSKPEEVIHLKTRGIKCVYDICDNKWRKEGVLGWKEKIIIPHNYICQNADAIVTTCQTMQKLIMKHTARDSIIITDPTEAFKREPNIRKNNIVKIYNYGNSKHFARVQWDKLIKSLKTLNIKFQLHCMLDRTKKFFKIYEPYLKSGEMILHEYDFETQYSLMKESDIVFLPIIKTRTDMTDIKCKSPNRMIDAIQSGKPVVTNTGVDSYEPFKKYVEWVDSINLDPTYDQFAQGILNVINTSKDILYNKIIEGQNYIEQNHSPFVVGKQWIELENKV